MSLPCAGQALVRLSFPLEYDLTVKDSQVDNSVQLAISTTPPHDA